MINRATVGIFDPDDQRLVELSHAYAATAICFEIQEAPSPPGEGVEALAKASGWRDGLTDEHGTAFAVLEVAHDRETAEAAWRDNVPDGLEARDDELPADPGCTATSTRSTSTDRRWWCGRRESRAVARNGSPTSTMPTAPSRSNATGQEVCAPTTTTPTAWSWPYRDRLPPADELPSAPLDGVPDREVRIYPAAEG